MRSSQIRQRRGFDHQPPLVKGVMTRDRALHCVTEYLKEDIFHPTALELIGLFSLEPEELAEAGVEFEQLKALEFRCRTIWGV